MPIFEYRCEKCGRSFEKFTLSSRRDEATCPTCGSDQVRRALSSFGTAGTARSASSSTCVPSG